MFDIDTHKGIRVDLGCGANKNPGFVGIDIQPLKGVDIVWDIERTPWPLPDDCALTVTASHILEHVSPHSGDKRLQPLIDLLVAKKILNLREARELGNPGPALINVMDEVWRVLKPYCQFAFVVPHGESPGFIQDPTHCTPFNETCVTPDTEVLTYSGYKLITDITPDDLVLSLNPQTNESEYISGNILTSFDRQGEMVHFSGRAIDLITNPNHRMWHSTRKLAKKNRWRFAPAEDFLTRDPASIVFSNRMIYEGNGITEWKIEDRHPAKPNSRLTNKSVFPIDVFADFMGWYLSEGSCEVTYDRPSSYRVHIAQKKDPQRAKIAEMVKELGFTPIVTPDSINFSAYALAPWLKQFGLCDQKFIPRDLLNAPISARQRLFDSLMAGDGCWIRNGEQFQFSVTSKRLADDFQVLAMSLGWRASVTPRLPARRGEIMGKEYDLKPQFLVAGSKYSDIYAKAFTKVEGYQGSVHSLQMPVNHIYMARRNGKCIWTGNTMHYFDPLSGTGLYQFYRPRPWKIEQQYFNPNGNLEVLLVKRPLDPSYEGVIPPLDITQEKR